MSNAAKTIDKLFGQLDELKAGTPTLTAVKTEPVSSQLENIQHKVETETKAWTLTQVPKLAAAQGLNAFELGGRLCRVQQDELWPDADKVSFVEWMDKQNILKSRGYELIKTYKAIVSFDLPPDILNRVGWSKLCLIVSRLKTGKGKIAAKNNNKWIKIAEDSSQLDLRDEVANAKGKSKPDLTQHVFKLPIDKEKTFKAAVDSAKKAVNVETEVEAVDAILSGYLEGNSKAVTLKTIMQQHQPEEVLEAFAELWPDIGVKVSV